MRLSGNTFPREWAEQILRIAHLGEWRPRPATKTVKYINSTTYKNFMEDHFDKIPVQYRTERLGRLRGLITQIEADYKRCNYLKQKIHLRVSDHSEMEEMLKMETWIKRDMTIYKRLNAVSIEGITFVGVGEFSSCP